MTVDTSFLNKER